MFSVLIIEGVKKIAQKIRYSNKSETVVRIFPIHDTRMPEKVLYESQTNPGTYLDEVENKIYKENNGRWVAL